jgi:hypothetical protein
VPPQTNYARLGGDRIAYQVLGEGPPDLILARRSSGPIDVAWEDRGITLFLRMLASFCRVILATLDGPGRALRCAAALRDELAGIGGIAVDVAARP